MKLTTAIKAATKGLERLEIQRAAMEDDVRERGKKLTALRAEYDAHREMLNAMLKLQDKMPEGETIEFNYSTEDDTIPR